MFDYFESNNEVYKELSIFIEEILYTIDFTGINFDNFKCSRYDFTGLKGAEINPQTILDKNLENTICSDVWFIGSFDGVKMNNDTVLEGSNFEELEPSENMFREKLKQLIKNRKQ